VVGSGFLSTTLSFVQGVIILQIKNRFLRKMQDNFLSKFKELEQEAVEELIKEAQEANNQDLLNKLKDYKSKK